MSAPKISMRTPLGRVRNLGSSHSGTSDFWRQRLTAVAMTVLIVPVIVIVLMLIGRNQAGAAQILGSLPIAIILLLFIIASAWHMKIGMQVVIEDYIHNETLKIVCIIANNFFSFAVAMWVIPGRPPSPWGMWVAVLPSIVNFRSLIVSLVIMSKPQKVKNRWVSTPSPRAALARIRPG